MGLTCRVVNSSTIPKNAEIQLPNFCGRRKVRVVLNAEHEVHFARLDSARAYSPTADASPRFERLVNPASAKQRATHWWEEKPAIKGDRREKKQAAHRTARVRYPASTTAGD